MNKLIKAILEFYMVVLKTLAFLFIAVGICGFGFTFPIFLAVEYSVWWLFLWCAFPIWLGFCNWVLDWIYDKYHWSLDNLFD